jgi:hypothetical protein
MHKNNKIKLSLPLSKDKLDEVVTYVRCAMAQYPEHVQGLKPENLLEPTAENQRTLDMVGSFRSEINFFCRDQLEDMYRIEEIFEPEGLRVYFTNPKDYDYFVKEKKTVSPPDLPEVILNQFL